MDEFTVGVLIECGFEELIDKFKDEEIGKNDFISLTELMVTELISKMGGRSSFYKKFIRFKKIQESKTNKLVDDNLNISNISNFEIYEDEVESVKTNMNLFSHENVFGNTQLDSNDRTEISPFIGGTSQGTEKDLITHVGISKKSLSTDEIVEANKAKNYVSSILNKYSDGKVVLNYYESVGTLSQYIQNSLSSIIIKHEIQQCIKINKNTFSLLAKGIEQLFLYETGKTYFTPYFKDENNIEIDFQTLYPGKDILLFHKFDVFKIKLINYIDKLKKRNDNISVLKLLPQLFQPLTIKFDKKHKRDGKPSIWRPSKAEQADSFVLFIPVKLKNVHAQKIEKAVQYSTTLQPYIIIVDNTDIYAVINIIYYKLETPLKALDICYKSYFALSLHYPQESEQIWLFIQNYFFDTTLKSDKHVLFVKTFINDLNNIEFKCNELNCFKIFNTFHSFKNHLNQHNNVDTHINTPLSCNLPVITTTSQGSSDLNNFHSFVETDNYLPKPHPEPITITEFLETLQSSTVSLASKWYSNNSIPRKIIQTLFDDIQFFNDSFLFNLKTKMLEIINLNQIDSNQTKDVFCMFDELSNTFSNIKTEHLRFKMFDKIGVLICPKMIEIEYRLNDKLRNSRVIFEPKTVTMSFIPLRFFLKIIFQDSNLFHVILKFMNHLNSSSGCNTISNFVQSQLWQSKLKKNPGKILIPLFLCFDDFEINNAGNIKLGAVYVSLPCLPPELAS
ncbi:hypothetical protein QTP88_007801 [Uroleucon formosanum]